MAVMAVPRALREKLGDDASDSLVDLLQQFEAEHTDHLIEMVEERFVRRVVESENRLRNELREEMHAGFMGLQTQTGDVRAEIGGVRTEFNKNLGSVRTDLGKEIESFRAELGKEIGSVRAELGKEIGSVRAELSKEIGSVRAELSKEIGSVRTELGKEIGSVRTDLGKEIAEVRKEITVQTRWILAVLVAAAVLVPIIQRVMEALLP